MTTPTPRDRALSALPFLRETCELLAEFTARWERKTGEELDPAALDGFRAGLRVAERDLAHATANVESIPLHAALHIELHRIDAERDADTDDRGRVYRATVRRARRRAIRDVLAGMGEHERPLGVEPEAAAVSVEGEGRS